MRLLFLGLAVLLASTSCMRSPTSQLQTTSDKLNEFSFVFEGQIELPLAKDPYLLAYLVEVERDLRENKTEQSARIDELKAALAGEDAFLSHFSSQNKYGFPILDKNGEVVKDNVKYWIARQLKYNLSILNQKNLSTTLKELGKVETEIANDHVIVKYKARMAAVRHVTGTGADLSKSPIAEGFVMKLPRNPLTYYFGAHNAALKSLSDKASFELAAVHSLLDQDKLIENLRTSSSSHCMSWDPTHLVSPFNEFYFFDSNLPDCQTEGLTDVITREVNSVPSQTTYPEFHRLFADKKLSYFIYYGNVDHEDVAAKNFAKDLEAKGYRIQSKSGSKNIELVGRVGDISIEVTLAVEKLNSDARRDFQAAMKTHEVVVYDGHAGFGANIDKHFTQYQSYPLNTYQIFLLNGCVTYKYGMIEVLDTKSFADFDFQNQNVDVITTYTVVSGHVQQEILLGKLEGAARAFSSDRWTTADVSAFEMDYSWLSIISAVNSASDASNRGESNGVFMVSGEEGNDYRPGKRDYQIASTKTYDEMMSLLKDPEQSEESKRRIMRGFFAKKFVGDAPGVLLTRMNEANSFCMELKGYSDLGQLLASDFYLPSCQVKGLDLTSGQSYEGFSIGLGRIEFHENARILQAPINSEFTVNGIAYQEPMTATVQFFANGQPKKGIPVHAYTSHGVAFEEWALLEFNENGSVRRGPTLSEVQKDGVEYYRGYLSFSPQGQVIEGRLKNDSVINGVKIAAGSNLKRTDSGMILEIDTRQANGDSSVIDPRQDLVVTKGIVRYYESGKLRFVSTGYETDTEVRPYGTIRFKARNYSFVSFYENGAIASAALSDNDSDLPFPCRLHNEENGTFNKLFYYPKGSFAGCALAQSFDYKGRSFKEGDYFILNEQGQVSEDASLGAFMLLYARLKLAEVSIFID